MNLFELFVRIGVQDDATDKIGEIGGKLKSGLATAGKVAAAGIGVATTAVGALAKAAVSSYADYEQLVGGVETLFGAGGKTLEEYAGSVGKTVEEAKAEYQKLLTAQEDVFGNALSASRTAGLSMNAYMETVTSFSASLIQSLGGDTAKAAEYADTAIRDMSDNANKMGTDISMIQNAYQGFAKQNYTMLDNLKLGYGGTAREMARLVNESGVLSEAQKINLDDTKNLGEALQEVGFSKIVEAIHAVQTEMGITGTTTAEASETISGSLNALKASWENLAVGIADENADFGILVADFADSVAIAAKNILPRVEQSLMGIGDLIAKLAPVAVDAVSDLITDVLPSALQAGASLLSAIGQGITSNFDSLLQTAFDLVGYLADGLISGADGVVDGAAQIVQSLAMWIEEYSDVLIEKALSLVMVLAEGIARNLPKIVLAAAKIVGALATGVIEYLPELIKQVPTIISELVAGFSDALPDIVAVGEDIVRGLWEGIQNLGGWLGEKIGSFFDGVVDGAKDLLGIHSPSRVFAGIGENMALGVGAGWASEYQNIKKGIQSGLEFGTGSVDFKSSAIGAMSRTTSSAASFGGEIVVEAPVYVGGSVVARNQYRFNLAEAQRRGNNLVTT